MKNIDKNALLKELEEQFAAEKKVMKLKSSLEEINERIYFKDYVLSQGFVPTSLSRNLAYKAKEHLSVFVGSMHNFLFPNPQSMVALTEANAITEEDKKEITRMMHQCMKIINKYVISEVNRDKVIEGQIVDETIQFYKENKKEIVRLLEKVNNQWTGKHKS